MSGVALYQLTGEYRAAALALAELDLDAQTVADTLESLSGALEVKSANVALMVLNMEASASAIKKRAGEMADRGKAAQAVADSLREYLQRNLAAAGIARVETPEVCIGWRRSTAVEIHELGLLPAAFMRVPEPPAPTPDKPKIAAALKAGADVPGAHLDHRRSLQIK